MPLAVILHSPLAVGVCILPLVVRLPSEEIGNDYSSSILSCSSFCVPHSQKSQPFILTFDQFIIQISGTPKMSTLRGDLGRNSPIDLDPLVGLHRPSPYSPLTFGEQLSDMEQSSARAHEESGE